MRFVNCVQGKKNSLLGVFNACANNVNDFQASFNCLFYDYTSFMHMQENNFRKIKFGLNFKKFNFHTNN